MHDTAWIDGDDVKILLSGLVFGLAGIWRGRGAVEKCLECAVCFENVIDSGAARTS